MSLTEYKPGQAFPGVIGRTFDVSKPAWPAPNRAKAGTRTCCSSFWTTLDSGSWVLRQSDPHAEHRCAGSRRAALQQHAHHGTLFAVPLLHAHRAQPPLKRLGVHYRGVDGLSRRNGYIPFENGMLSEILLQQGYNTYAIGKWHLTPSEATSAAGPYDRWPLGRGFERYYGFLGGDTHQYYPELVRDNQPDRAERRPKRATT